MGRPKAKKSSKKKTESKAKWFDLKSDLKENNETIKILENNMNLAVDYLLILLDDDNFMRDNFDEETSEKILLFTSEMKDQINDKKYIMLSDKDLEKKATEIGEEEEDDDEEEKEESKEKFPITSNEYGFCVKGEVHEKLCIGDQIELTDEAKANYNGNFWGKWIITDFTNDPKANGYDSSISPQYLISCKGLHISIYEYEFNIVKHFTEIQASDLEETEEEED